MIEEVTYLIQVWY